MNKVCSFSDGSLCGFDLNLDGFKWNLYTPSSRLYLATPDEIAKADLGPLPIFDHSTEGVGSGYVYAKSAGFPSESTANMTSQEYTPFSTNLSDTGQCLEFYFFLQDTDAIQLNMKLKRMDNITYKLLWSREVDHSNFWWKGEVNVKVTSNYRILYQAVVKNNSTNGLVALDDISLRNGQCSK